MEKAYGKMFHSLTKVAMLMTRKAAKVFTIGTMDKLTIKEAFMKIYGMDMVKCTGIIGRLLTKVNGKKDFKMVMENCSKCYLSQIK